MPETNLLDVLLKIGLALAKHHIKNVIGNEALEVAADMLADVGGEKVQAKVDSIFESKEGQKELLKAAKSADERFKEKCKDNDLLQLFAMDYGDLPSVQKAIASLPEVLDEDDLRETLFTAFRNDASKNISDEKINEGVNLYIECLQSALIPVKDFGLRIIYNVLKAIGKDVKDTKVEIGNLKTDIKDIKSFLDKNQGKRGVEEAREKYLRVFIERYSAPPAGILDLGDYEQLPLQLQSNQSEPKKKRNIGYWNLADHLRMWSGEMLLNEEINLEDNIENMFDEDYYGGPNTVLPKQMQPNKIRYRFNEIESLPKKLVLTGPQGSGKTTLLRRESLLAATKALSDLTSPVPVMVDLLEWEKTDSFAAFIRDLQENRINPIWRSLNLFGDLQDLMVSNNVILYLDGLDELDQKRLLEIKDVVQGLECSVVIACRVDNYGDRMDFGLSEIALQPLQLNDILRFANVRINSNRAKDFVNHLRVWEENEGSRDQDFLKLANLPFFLVLMLSHFEEEGWKEAPNRWQLLNYVIHRIWDNTIKTEKTIDRFQIKPFEKVESLIVTLAPLALSYLSTRTIPIDVFKNKVPETVITALSESGFIFSDSQSVRFRHMIFQEFLAAHELFEIKNLEPFTHSSLFASMLVMLANSDENQRFRVEEAVFTYISIVINNKSRFEKTSISNTLWILGQIGVRKTAMLLLDAIPDDVTQANPELLSALGKIANRLSDDDLIKQKIIESIGSILIGDPNIPVGDWYDMWLGNKDENRPYMPIGDVFKKLSHYTDAAKALSEIKCQKSAEILVDGYLKFTKNYKSDHGPGYMNLYRREFLVALSKIGKIASPLIINLVWNEDPLVCITAAEVLSYAWATLPAAKLIPVLIKHPIELVRAHVAIALGATKDIFALPFLIDALHDDGLASYGTAGPYVGVNKYFFYVSDAAAYALTEFDSAECREALRNNGYTEDGHPSLELLLERIKTDRDVNPKGNLHKQWVQVACEWEGGLQAILPCLGHVHRGPDAPSFVVPTLMNQIKAGNNSSINIIIEFIDTTQDRDSRMVSTLLLAELGNLDIEAYLRHLIASDEDPVMRMTACGALVFLVARNTETFSPEKTVPIEEIVVSGLRLADLQGASGLGKGIAEAGKFLVNTDVDSVQIRKIIRRAVSEAIKLTSSKNKIERKVGIKILEEIASDSEVYRWALARVLDDALADNVLSLVGSSPSFHVRHSLNIFERLKYLNVDISSKDYEGEKGGFPVREFFVQETLDVRRALKKAREEKSENIANWAQDFNEEDWNQLGYDDGLTWYLIGRTDKYLGESDDARKCFEQSETYYRGLNNITEQQKLNLIKTLLALKFKVADGELSEESFGALERAADFVHGLAEPLLGLHALTEYASACRDRSDWKDLIQISKEIIRLTESKAYLIDKHISAHIMIGQAYLAIGDLESAMNDYQVAINIGEKHGFLEKSIAARIGLAILYGRQTDARFMNEMTRISDYYTATEQWDDAAKVMLVIGEQAFSKKILLQALVFQSALEYFEKAGSSADIFEVAFALRQSTNILLALEKAEDAKSNYEHWLQLIENQNGLDGKVTILTDYSYLLAHMGLRRDAEKNILRAVNLIGPEHEMSSAVIQAFLEVRENPRWNLPSQRVWGMLQACLIGLVYEPEKATEVQEFVRGFKENAAESHAQLEQEFGQGLLNLFSNEASIILSISNPYKEAFEALLQTIERTRSLVHSFPRLFDEAMKLTYIADQFKGLDLIKSVPELMGDEGVRILECLFENAKSLRDDGSVEILGWAIDMQKLCQERGIEISLNAMSQAPSLGQAMAELISAGTPQAMKAILEKHPELMSEDTDRTLNIAIRGAEIANEPRLLGYLRYNRGFLQYLRSRGVEGAAEDMERSFTLLQSLFDYLLADTDANARIILESHPEILSDTVQRLIQEWLELPDMGEAFRKTVTSYKRLFLLKISRELGSKLAFEQLLPVMIAGEALFALISAQDEESVQAVLLQNPVLLSNEMDEFLKEVTEINWAPEDREIRDEAVLYREFLTQCRIIGIEKAMEYIHPRFEDISNGKNG